MDTSSTGDPSALQCQDYSFSQVVIEGEGKQHNMKEGKTKGVVRLLNVTYRQGLEYRTPIMEICTPVGFQMSYFVILHTANVLVFCYYG
jgi:hypothetical protein